MTIYPSSRRRGDRRGQRIKDTETIASMARVTPMLDQVVREVSNLRLKTEEEIKALIQENYKLLILTPSKRLAGQYYFRDKQDGFTAEAQVEKLLSELMNNEDYLYRKRWLDRVKTRIGILKWKKEAAIKASAEKKSKVQPKSPYVIPQPLIDKVTQEVKEFPLGLTGKISSCEKLAEEFKLSLGAVRKALKLGLDPEIRKLWLQHVKQKHNPAQRRTEISSYVKECLDRNWYPNMQELRFRFGAGYRAIVGGLGLLGESDLELWRAYGEIVKTERFRLRYRQRPYTYQQYAEKYGIDALLVQRMLETTLTVEETSLRNELLATVGPAATSYWVLSPDERAEILAIARREIASGVRTVFGIEIQARYRIGRNTLYKLLHDNLTPEEMRIRKLIGQRQFVGLTEEGANKLLAHVRAEILKGDTVTSAKKLGDLYGGRAKYIRQFLKDNLSEDECAKRLALAHKREPRVQPHLRARNHHMTALAAIKALGELFPKFENKEYKESIVNDLLSELNALK